MEFVHSPSERFAEELLKARASTFEDREKWSQKGLSQNLFNGETQKRSFQLSGFYTENKRWKKVIHIWYHFYDYPFHLNEK